MTQREQIRQQYPVTTRIEPRVLDLCDPETDLVDLLKDQPELLLDHPYLAELASLEQAYQAFARETVAYNQPVSGCMINPSLKLLEVAWTHLATLFGDSPLPPVEKPELLLLYRHPESGQIVLRPASNNDLLVLKIVGEQLSAKSVSQESGLTIGQVDDLVFCAIADGLIVSPPSRLVRSATFPRGEGFDERHFSTPTFTLQWHITQACDLHCKHCYDRSDRQTMPFDFAIRVLDQLYDFCARHYVYGQVTFTGGNPLLYPHFLDLYQEAASRGFLTAVLGNPMPRHRIEEMVKVQVPEFYQVSLEGLPEHNDYIRGKDHFRRVIEFLAVLKDLGIYSMVMLTLTRDNMDQVLDLARLLEGKVDLFTFNRLAMVGEGAALASAPIDEFPQFLRRYQEAAKQYDCLGFKDNLFNVLRYTDGAPYTGGCAGYGCGAAFNFLSLLPDGEVHACRKLPSCLGNLHTMSLESIYHSPLAEQYRLGPQGCRTCPIRPVCGGCLAVSYGFGKDIFSQPDPYCFF